MLKENFNIAIHKKHTSNGQRRWIIRKIKNKSKDLEQDEIDLKKFSLSPEDEKQLLHFPFNVLFGS